MLVAFDTEWAWSQKDSIFVVTQKLNDRLQFVARGHETGDSHFGKISFSVENADNSEVSRTDLPSVYLHHLAIVNVRNKILLRPAAFLYREVLEKAHLFIYKFRLNLHELWFETVITIICTRTIL